MEVLIVLICVLLVKISQKGDPNSAPNYKIKRKIKRVKRPTQKQYPPKQTTPEEDLPIQGAYQQKWLLTYNEKAAYKMLKQICDRNNLHLMTKVRLLDIVEPIKGIRKYQTYFYKIQAKHVDFVICDEKLVARCIIELDDSSHDQEDRMERDRFVDRVLESVGYQVLRTRNVTEGIEAEILKTIPSVTK